MATLLVIFSLFGTPGLTTGRAVLVKTGKDLVETMYSRQPVKKL